MRTPINIPIIKPNNIFPLLLFDSYLGVFMRYYMYGVDVMVIYVDVLIFVNTLINYCILSLAHEFLKHTTSQLRLITAAIIGALSALVIFIPIDSIILQYTIKLVVNMLMCRVAFCYTKLSYYIKQIIYTLIISIIFGGIMILIYQTAKPTNMAIINDYVYFQIEPVTLILLSVVIYIVIYLIQRTIHKGNINTLVNLDIHIKDTIYNCIGKIDTGCTVVEPFSGSPVIIIENSIVNLSKISANRLVPYKALGNSGILSAIKADRVYIDKAQINKEIYICIYCGTIDNNVKAIINSEIIR